jgi:hypothetical protein
MKRDSNDKIIVKLATWEYRRASDVGIARYVENWGRQDANHYKDKERQEDNRTASVAAAIVELAVAKYRNKYWHGHVWHASQHENYHKYADIGCAIEARRNRVSEGCPIREQQNDIEGLIVWCGHPEAPEFREVQILGWIPQLIGWKIGSVAKFDDSNKTRLVPLESLYHPKVTAADLKITETECDVTAR